MEILIANNADSVLTAAITAAATSLTIRAADASKFPNPASGTQGFYATLERKNTAEVEIVLVTARAGATFTVVRAQDNTTALTFSVGDLVGLRPNAAAVDARAGQLARQLLNNGAFQVWQNGASGVSGAAVNYGPDGWAFVRDAGAVGATVTRVTGDQAQYACRVQRANLNAGVGSIYLMQSVRSVNSIPYRGRALLLAFRARMVAGYSAAGALLTAVVRSGTGTDEPIAAGFTGSANLAFQAVTLTTAWQNFVVPTTAMGAGASQLGVMFIFTPTGVAGATDYYEIEEIALVPAVAGVGRFPYRSESDERRAAEVFFEKSYVTDEAPGTVGSVSGYVQYITPNALNSQGPGGRFRVVKRTAAPTITLYSPVTGAVGKAYDVLAVADVDVAAEAISDGGFNVYVVAGTLNSHLLRFHWTADARI
jgi:hypothetical protein